MIGGREDLQKAYRDDDVAREYVATRFTSPLGALLHARQASIVKRVIRDNGIERAVEIAPGPARLTVDIAPELKQVILLDASVQMLDEARRRLGERQGSSSCTVQFIQADAFSLPLRDRLDLVYSFRLIRHFERADRIRLYRQMAGILSPGGWLVFDAVNEIVSAPLRANAKPGEYLHYDALLRPDTLTEELREAELTLASLIGVQHRYGAMVGCQVYLAPRLPALARAAMEVLDRLGGEPLEWVAVCRRG